MINKMGDRLSQIGTGRCDYDLLDNTGPFLARSSLVNINGLKIGSIASKSSVVKVDQPSVNMLMIPFAGQATYQTDRQTIQIETGFSAVYLAKTKIQMEGLTRSVLMAEIDTKRLEAIARCMLGLEQNAPLNFDLERPQSLSLQHGNISLHTIYSSMANMIDGVMSQQDLLNHSRIDDNFYRTTAMLMLPHLFLFQDPLINKNRSERLLERACQYIGAHQDQVITLSDLEHVSGMSARNLQLEFRKRYQCTPMQWIRQQRLSSARERLLKAAAGISVTAVALMCGFNKPSEFTHQYKLRFGEMPSATLARSVAA
jgi:AraC-like DNA-binding protein